MKLFQRKKKRTLKELIESTDRGVSQYKEQMLEHVRKNIKNTIHVTRVNNVYAYPLASAYQSEEWAIQVAIGSGDLNPRYFLSMVDNDLPNGHYKDNVLKAIREEYTRNKIPIKETV